MDGKQRFRQFLIDAADVIKLAQAPFMNLVMLIVPYLTPILPMYVIYEGVLNVLGWEKWIAVTAGIVVEGLGITSVFTSIKFFEMRESKGRKVFAVAIYLIYLSVVLTVGVIFGWADGEAWWRILAIGLFSLLSFPSGSLASLNNLVSTQEDRDEQLRQEKREDRLKSKALKAGINIFGQQVVTNEQAIPQVAIKHASDFKDFAFELLDTQYKADRTVLTPRQLTTLVNQKKRVSLDHDKCKGTWTNFTKEWKQSRGL